MNKQELTNAFKQKIYWSTVNSNWELNLEEPTLEEIESVAESITNNIDLRYGELLSNLVSDSEFYLVVGDTSLEVFEARGATIENFNREAFDDDAQIYMIGKNQPDKDLCLVRSIATSIILNGHDDEFIECHGGLKSIYHLDDKINGSSLNESFMNDFKHLKGEEKFIAKMFSKDKLNKAKISLFKDIFTNAAFNNEAELERLENLHPNFYATSMAFIDDLMKKYNI